MTLFTSGMKKIRVTNGTDSTVLYTLFSSVEKVDAHNLIDDEFINPF